MPERSGFDLFGPDQINLFEITSPKIYIIILRISSCRVGKFKAPKIPRKVQTFCNPAYCFITYEYCTYDPRL
jgi:hypothetical protein